MAWVSVGMAGVQFISGSMMAQVTREQAETTKMVADMNAGFEELDAFHALQEGDTEKARYQSTVDSTISDQRTAMAGAGVDVGFGTAKEIQDETKVTGLLNGLDLQNQARQKAYGLQIGAINTRLGGVNAYAAQMASAAQQQGQATIAAGGMLAHGFENKYSTSKGLTGYTNSKGTD